MNVLGQTHRAVTHAVSAVANITEAADILSSVAIVMANIQKQESLLELEDKQQALYLKYPHLKPAVQ